MKLSLTITSFPEQPLAPFLSEVGRAADAAGLDSVWVADHLLQADPTRDLHDPTLEAYTTLGYLAAQTSRVHLGTLVSAVTYRPAALLIKAVTTLDVLSNGRAWLGLGAGYHQGEADALGLPLPPTPERFATLEETLQLTAQMWRGDASPFHGAHIHAAQPIGAPFPLSQPRPRILIGGTGEQRTLPLVARYADACNLFDIPDGGVTVRRKLEVLHRACNEIDRPWATLEKSIVTRLRSDERADALAGRCQTFGELGLDHVVFLHPSTWTAADVALVGEAAGQLAA
ncbi:MAG: TIGR03560 family F420-dependent LLM class oxidoreductase [Thermomicrobiales bacterium]|nr:TIGR03560 family F420-dependent LLM class oxidoreductase [Thermomicrobiales bacterium]